MDPGGRPRTDKQCDQLGLDLDIPKTILTWYDKVFHKIVNVSFTIAEM